MKECRKMESLIYLCRKGELSADESKRVIEHTNSCSQCRGIIQQLLAIDAALLPLREKVPDLSGGIALVNNTIDRIAKLNVNTAVSKKNSLIIDEISGWLRPVLGFILLAATLLFVTQQSRDARKIADLEIHLRTMEGSVGSDVFHTNSDMHHFVDIVTSEEEKGFSSSHSLNNASIGVDPTRMIGSELFELFKKKNGLFDYLSSRYPNLSTVNIEDGINERERKILATEGKALMKDIEQLTQEGEK